MKMKFNMDIITSNIYLKLSLDFRLFEDRVNTSISSQNA